VVAEPRAAAVPVDLAPAAGERPRGIAVLGDPTAPRTSTTVG